MWFKRLSQPKRPASKSNGQGTAAGQGIPGMLTAYPSKPGNPYMFKITPHNAYVQTIGGEYDTHRHKLYSQLVKVWTKDSLALGSVMEASKASGLAVGVYYKRGDIVDVKLDFEHYGKARSRSRLPWGN